MTGGFCHYLLAHFSTSAVGGTLVFIAFLLLVVHIVLGTISGDGDDGSKGVVGILFIVFMVMGCGLSCLGSSASKYCTPCRREVAPEI
mmetsp:Transcript_63790/g.113200  ORF Transcript_63790/g.113200 Transcript_63790/m.113200 type:complete len:88 (+) Transcript_63790:3-266(+)